MDHNDYVIILLHLIFSMGIFYVQMIRAATSAARFIAGAKAAQSLLKTAAMTAQASTALTQVPTAIVTSSATKFSLPTTTSSRLNATAPAPAGGEERNLEVTSLGLHQNLVHSLQNTFNITKLFPIQAQVFRPIFEGKDLVGKSKTGTGKVCVGFNSIHRTFDFPLINHP